MRRLLATSLMLLLAAAVAVGAQPQPKLVEAIVVRVNDRILTIADMRERALEKSAESGRPLPADQYPALVAEATDELCLLERATELKVDVSEEEVDQAVKQLREQNRVADDATFEEMVRSMGLTVKQLRNRLRDTITVNRVLSREMTPAPITEEELRQRYEREQDRFRTPEQVHLAHVVFSLAADRSDEAIRMAEARRLVGAARSGEDFLALVKIEVDGGHASGGDLGNLAEEDLRSEVRDVVKTMKPGDVSDPFVSPAGIHVVKVLERIPSAVRPFSEVTDELRQLEMAERYRAHFSDVVDGIKKRYVVESHPELFTPPTP